MRLAVLVPLAITAVGLVLVLTTRTLFGLVLVLGGLGALGVLVGLGAERLGDILGDEWSRRPPRK